MIKELTGVTMIDGMMVGHIRDLEAYTAHQEQEALLKMLKHLLQAGLIAKKITYVYRDRATGGRIDSDELLSDDPVADAWRYLDYRETRYTIKVEEV